MSLDPAYAILFIWDVENARICFHRVPGMMKNILMSLKTVDERYHIVKKVLVGNLNLDFIQKNGVSKERRIHFHRCTA